MVRWFDRIRIQYVLRVLAKTLKEVMSFRDYMLGLDANAKSICELRDAAGDAISGVSANRRSRFLMVWQRLPPAYTYRLRTSLRMLRCTLEAEEFRGSQRYRYGIGCAAVTTLWNFEYRFISSAFVTRLGMLTCARSLYSVCSRNRDCAMSLICWKGLFFGPRHRSSSL